MSEINSGYDPRMYDGAILDRNGDLVDDSMKKVLGDYALGIHPTVDSSGGFVDPDFRDSLLEDGKRFSQMIEDLQAFDYEDGDGPVDRVYAKLQEGPTEPVGFGKIVNDAEQRKLVHPGTPGYVTGMLGDINTYGADGGSTDLGAA